MRPVLTLYRGAWLSQGDLARVTGIRRNTIQWWHGRGQLSEAWIDAYKRDVALRSMARGIGLSLWTARRRVRDFGWDDIAAYSTPAGVRPESREEGP